METKSDMRKCGLTWDDMLDQATEDISSYRWAIDLWQDPPPGYDSDYLLLTALCSRARGRSALDAVNSNLPANDRMYQKKLENLWMYAENTLNEQIKENETQITRVIIHQFVLRLERLEKELAEIRRMHEDTVFHDDPGLYEDALYDACQDVFLEFRDMFLAYATIVEKSLLEDIDSKGFHDKLERLVNGFRANFEYFYPIAGLFPSIRSREYNADLWWLKRTPSRESIQEQTLPEEMLNILAHACETATYPETQECAMAEQAIRYVFGELSARDRKAFWNHLLVCPVCVDIVLDMRVAEDESKESGKHFEETPAWLIDDSARDLGSPGKSFFDEIKSIFPKLADSFSELEVADDYWTGMKRAAGKSEEPPPNSRRLKTMSAYQLPLIWNKRWREYMLMGPESNQPSFMKFHEIIDRGKGRGLFYWAGLIEREGSPTEFVGPDEIKELPCHSLPEETCKRIFVFVASGKNNLLKLRDFYEQGNVDHFLRCLMQCNVITISYEKPEERE